MNNKFYTIAALLLLSAFHVIAGNPDRQGQAGAAELLMNPWGRSAGLHSMSTSSVMGVEAMRINIAGLSRIKKLEIGISNNRLFSGTGMNLNSFGLGFKMGKSGAFGVEFASLDFGQIPVTTVNQPAGTGGFFSPSFFQLGLGYSFTYANKISVGMLMRLVSESIQDVTASGVAIDAGVQYVAGPKDNFKLGIALRNVGSPMVFGGEGLSTKRGNPDPAGGVTYELTYDARAASFELPSMLNMGVSYDFYFGSDNYLRGLANFTSNAFSRDQVGAGLEFSFQNLVALRAAYKYDLGKTDVETKNVYTGLSAGASVEVPISKGGANNLGIDYAYRTTNPFKGTHNLTLRFSF
ncbi:MAG: PorV/PorQ family protein [Saprospiraceae bacterium]|jgi:opacity protein-like surface antigen|nr:PorV/PorQ family protein [Saprospiraceae bacterium]MBK8668542.1 PorV/PorQ family protein [Saprospiraceae bacterium]MBL0098867.1 PorV/PorQ family protein [Saprospiraceae bacterium]